MLECQEQAPALMFLEYYGSVESPLALTTEKQITHVQSYKSLPIPTNPGFHYWELVLPVLPQLEL